MEFNLIFMNHKIYLIIFIVKNYPNQTNTLNFVLIFGKCNYFTNVIRAD